MDIAPDGTVWATVVSVSWGGGGLLRYNPGTNNWTYWANGGEHMSVQRKPNGGYIVWIDIGLSMITFDSNTQQFTTLPNTWVKNQMAGLPGKDCVDDQGNLWAFRVTAPGEPFSLDYRDVNGVWHKVPFAYPYVTDDIWAFRAFGNKKALLVKTKPSFTIKPGHATNAGSRIGANIHVIVGGVKCKIAVEIIELTCIGNPVTLP